jgi:hypothetical protein
VFAIADPDLHLLSSSRWCSATWPTCSDTGLPVEGAPCEEPFNPPSEVATLAPA